MGRSRLEQNVIDEIEALRQRLPLLNDMQLSGLLTVLRAVVPEQPKPTLM